MSMLSRRMLAQARVIAKGTRIRDVRRLVARYGGRPSKWVKKSSPRFEMRPALRVLLVSLLSKISFHSKGSRERVAG